jgi:hypothetical protein
MDTIIVILMKNNYLTGNLEIVCSLFKDTAGYAPQK